jgi:hypothetical protein
MNHMLQNYLKNKVIFWFTFCLFALIVFLEIINHRFEMNDFKVYYLAAKAFFNNEPIYGVQFGLDSGYYKYSPVFILLFSPYLIFSYKTACILHALILAVSTVMTLISARNILLKHVVQSEIQNKYLLIFAIFITVNHLFREIHLGNLNMIIVMLLCLGFQKMLEGDFILPGFLIALAIFIKPYLIILIIPLFFHKKIKFIWSLSLWIGFLFFLPITFLGSNKFIQLNQKWIHEIFQHGAYLYSNHTFTSLIRNYITLQLNEHSHMYFLLGLIFIYTLVYLITLKKYSAISEKNNQKALIFSYFILLAIIPNVLITDTEHFLYSTPIILFSIYSLYSNHNTKLRIAFVIFSILYAMNSPDILGKFLSAKFEDLGILGMANLGLIVTFILLQRAQKTHE